MHWSRFPFSSAEEPPQAFADLHLSRPLPMHREERRARRAALRVAQRDSFISARTGASRSPGSRRPETPPRARRSRASPLPAGPAAPGPRPSPARSGSASSLKDAAAAARPTSHKKAEPPPAGPPSPIPPRIAAGSPFPTRAGDAGSPASLGPGVGSGPAGSPDHTGPLGRGAGGVALPWRPGPRSRLHRLRRKAGATASSFRFPLHPPSVGQSGATRDARPPRPPHALQGPT
jgi:hypothetical protein